MPSIGDSRLRPGLTLQSSTISKSLGGQETVNPIALVMIVLGVLLLLFGIFLVVKRMKIVGIVISLLGLGVAAVPWLVSFLVHWELP
jgi:hypothetical protein